VVRINPSFSELSTTQLNNVPKRVRGTHRESIYVSLFLAATFAHSSSYARFLVVGDDNTIDADCGEPAFVSYQLFEGSGPGGTWAELLHTGRPLKIYDRTGALQASRIPYARIGVAILQLAC